MGGERVRSGEVCFFFFFKKGRRKGGGWGFVGPGGFLKERGGGGL